ncbi:uncharacterized protein LOC123299180 [Chrysoperla carnea]|uniref:uncharacterized protein LOC123299180 n=1 Tax=Chrysoperla carnea TaxID=189513 RepID=UPI001D061171|nr:uncharacterized protein LOC123299180 [Chrysoperla carnea]
MSFSQSFIDKLSRTFNDDKYFFKNQPYSSHTESDEEFEGSDDDAEDTDDDKTLLEDDVFADENSKTESELAEEITHDLQLSGLINGHPDFHTSTLSNFFTYW